MRRTLKILWAVLCAAPECRALDTVLFAGDRSNFATEMGRFGHDKPFEEPFTQWHQSEAAKVAKEESRQKLITHIVSAEKKLSGTDANAQDQSPRQLILDRRRRSHISLKKKLSKKDSKKIQKAYADRFAAETGHMPRGSPVSIDFAEAQAAAGDIGAKFFVKAYRQHITKAHARPPHQLILDRRRRAPTPRTPPPSLAAPYRRAEASANAADATASNYGWDYAAATDAAPSQPVDRQQPLVLQAAAAAKARFVALGKQHFFAFVGSINAAMAAPHRHGTRGLPWGPSQSEESEGRARTKILPFCAPMVYPPPVYRTSCKGTQKCERLQCSMAEKKKRVTK